MPDVVEVVQVLGSVVEIEAPRVTVVEIPTAVGPRGPAGASALVYRFAQLATWSCTHNLGRPPVVALYDADGYPFVCGALVATDSAVIVSLPDARSGSMVLV